MAGLQPYRFEPERAPNAEDSVSENEEVNDRLEAHFGVLVRELKPCQRKENVFVAENSQTKWKVEFEAYTALVAVNGQTIFFVNCFRY